MVQQFKKCFFKIYQVETSLWFCYLQLEASPVNYCYTFMSCLKLKTNGNRDTLDTSKYIKPSFRGTKEMDIQKPLEN